MISINNEAQFTIANHGLLYQLSDAKNGKMYFPNQLDELKKDIEENPDIVAVSYSEKSLKDVLHLKWIFFFILALATTEWFLRKYLGSY